MISKPRTALGGGLLAAVLLISGCQARVGSAATVGSSRISVATLDAATRDAASITAGKTASATLESQVLTQLVELQQVREVARREHVVVSQGAIDAAYTQIVAGSTATAQTTAANKRQAESQATYKALATSFADRGGKVDSAQLYGVPVKDQATANLVLAKLKADLGNAAALAQQYSSIKTVGDAGGQLGQVSFGASNGLPQAATAKVNQPFIATVQGTLAVFMVTARLDTADVAAAVAKYAKIKINPRFGTWGTVTSASGTAPGVTALGSDVVSPTPAAASAAPAASVAPATTAPAATAPAATAPAATATPQSTSAPQATTAPVPTTAPSAAPTS